MPNWQHCTDVLCPGAEGPTFRGIRIPMEVGASDWTLLIEFQDGKVAAVRVSTADGPPPKDGPQGKQKDAG